MPEGKTPSSKLVCSTCGKHVGGAKARSDVTRFLFWESRCTCVVPANEEMLKRLQPESRAANPAAKADQPAAAEIPDSVRQLLADRYEVLSVLGQGGMGCVYKVRDVQLDKIFAIKVLNANLVEDNASYKRFEQEARAASELTHANVVALYQFTRAHNGTPFLVMDFLDGDDLSTILKAEGFLDVRRALDIFIQSAEAIAHAHMKGIVHRDIKPSNIILVKSPGGMDNVKLVDFGIAKVASSEQAAQHLTQTGEIFGSPLYMSPEQCLGNKLDLRSDIYSLGCVMYESLTGQPPFTAENPIKTILGHINETPEAPTATANGAQLPADVEAIILRCLEKEPEHRYQTADDLLADLQAARAGRPIKKVVRKPIRKHNSTGLLAGAAAVIILGGLSWFAITHLAPGMSPVPTVKQQSRPETYEGRTLAQWTAEIEANPDDPELYVNRGMLHNSRDERTNAVDDYTEAIRLDPSNFYAYIHRGSVYTSLANYPKAMADANKSIELAPASDRGYELRAFVGGATEDFDNVVKDLKTAISLSGPAHEKNDSKGYQYYSLANTYVHTSQFDEALKAIDTAIEQSPKSEFLAVRGFIHTVRQEWDKAETDLKEAVAMDRARGVEWQLLAYYYACIGKMDEAEKASQQGMVLETFPARGYRLRGEIYRTAGLNDKALQEFSSETSLEEYAPGYRQRAVVYLNLKQPRSALTDLRKAIALNPKSAQTRALAAVVEDQLGMKAEAAANLKAAFAQTSKPPIVYVYRATIELNAGDTSAAIADCDTAIKLDPWLKEAYEVRSQAHARAGDSAAAKADTDKAGHLVSHLDL